MTATRNNSSSVNMTVTDIARLVGGEIVGDGHAIISGFSGIKEAKGGDLTFLADLKYESFLKDTQATAVFVPRGVSCPGKTIIQVEHPAASFNQALQFLLKNIPNYKPQGIHPTVIMGANVRLGKNVAIGPYTIIESGVVIGDETVIYANCYIGHETILGQGCLIYPQVVIRENTLVGNQVIVHSGTVIGSDGYGYVMVDGAHMKIPQTGIVVIEDDVEIGANVAIDRARFNKTVIGQGTKIDNLVHIAHNVIVGKHCLIIAQVGVSGSTRLGNYVILAGQVGVVGHLEIGDGVVVLAQSGVSKSVKAGEQIYGSPAQSAKEAFRSYAHIQRLDQYVQTIKELKQRIEKLENKS